MAYRARNRLGLNLRGAVLIGLIMCAAPPSPSAAECPTAADEIVTDRPDVTNSSLVVPYGSFQVENGLDWTSQLGHNSLDGSNSRLRLGVGRCTELVIDVPSYSLGLNRAASSGFSNVIVSFKRQLDHLPYGFDLSATAGAGFPVGANRLSGSGFAPYIQFPWSRMITGGWSVEGMFTLTWFVTDAANDPIFESTFALEREVGAAADLFVEYAGDYPNYTRPAHVLDAGGAWRLTPRQQIDFHTGFGLNAASVGQFFGVGYSFRHDRLFGP